MSKIYLIKRQPIGGGEIVNCGTDYTINDNQQLYDIDYIRVTKTCDYLNKCYKEKWNYWVKTIDIDDL